LITFILLCVVDNEAQILDTIGHRYGKILKFKIRYGRDTLIKKIKFKLNIKTQNTNYGLAQNLDETDIEQR
jgi:hypothetical protein